MKTRAWVRRGDRARRSPRPAARLALALCVAAGVGWTGGPGVAAAQPAGSADAVGTQAAIDADLAVARAATARRDFATALPLFERLVQRAPTNADLLIEAARVFGWADRNARAAELYRQALAVAPTRRTDIVPSLAWQTFWSADAADALPLFEEAVALQPGERALGWGLGRVLNATGRHREAIAAFQRWSPPSTEDERLDLARALRWAGYEDRAWPLLQAARAPDAVWLRDYRVAREVAPYAYASFELTEDRDTLRTRGAVLGAGLRPSEQANIELGARWLDLDDDFGAASATSFEVSGRTRLGEPDSAAGTWWPQLVVRTHRIGSWQPLTSALRLKWVPADRWRVDAEHTRELVETPRALANRVTVDVTSLGADWRRDERLALVGGVARLRFDDGTARQRLVARAEWALRTRPRWTVAGEWSHLERIREGAPGSDARGYWNPRRYEEARVSSALAWDWHPWELQARAGLARSREIDSTGNASNGHPHLWELTLAWDPSPAWRLRASAGGSGQALGLGSAGASGAGYWRRWALVSLNGWF